MQWDPARGIYLTDDGAVVPPEQVRAALDRVVGDTQERLLVLGARRAEGMGTLEWRAAVQTELKTAHLGAAALAHGGTDQLDRSTLGAVGARLRSQYEFLSGLALDTAPGEFNGAAMARLAQYGNGAVRGTYSHVVRRDAEGRGHDEEKNELGSGNPCTECPVLTDQGWVPIGTLPEVGSRECKGNCSCQIITRQSQGAAVGAEA